MTTTDALYRELKPDVERLANPLFDASRRFVKKRGAFLPHGAVLTTEGEVRLTMAVVTTLIGHGINAIHLAVRPENVQARALYESLDFRVVPRLLMTRRVTPPA
jgi:hypothetical protein